jgi:hypothetical protein
MLARLALVLLLTGAVLGCVEYEYEHEFWLRTDGSGTVSVTGRPALVAAFKGLGRIDDAEGTVTREGAQRFFEEAGLRVNRVTLTRRGGRPYLFVSAEFDDVNRLAASGAFPDLEIALRREGRRLRLEGAWRPPKDAPVVPPAHREGLLAVRFHLPSKVFFHENAVEGVERGNILSWRCSVAEVAGRPLAFGAVMDDRSILFSTVLLFAAAIAVAGSLLAGAFYLVARRGRKALQREARG